MARELHDSLNQLLFSVALTAGAAAEAVRRDPDDAVRLLHDIGGLAGQAQAELRVLVQGLRPPDLDADGLVGSLRKRAALLSRAYGIDIAVTVGDGADDGSDPPELEPSVERDAYRVVQEALSNALRHGDPRHIAVVVHRSAGPAPAPPIVVIDVTDDGHGFDVAAQRGSGRRLGLVTMRERAAAAGGRVEVRSQPGRGTTVTLEVPGG